MWESTDSGSCPATFKGRHSKELVKALAQRTSQAPEGLIHASWLHLNQVSSTYLFSSHPTLFLFSPSWDPGLGLTDFRSRVPIQISLTVTNGSWFLARINSLPGPFLHGVSVELCGDGRSQEGTHVGSGSRPGSWLRTGPRGRVSPRSGSEPVQVSPWRSRWGTSRSAPESLPRRLPPCAWWQWLQPAAPRSPGRSPDLVVLGACRPRPPRRRPPGPRPAAATRPAAPTPRGSAPAQPPAPPPHRQHPDPLTPSTRASCGAHPRRRCRRRPPAPLRLPQARPREPRASCSRWAPAYTPPSQPLVPPPN